MSGGASKVAQLANTGDGTEAALWRCVLSRPLIALLFSAATAATVGCEGSLVSTLGGDDHPDAANSGSPDAGAGGAAKAMFVSTVQPILTTNCSGCHAGNDGNGWLRPNPDAYTSVMAFSKLVDTGSPTSSTMLTRGQHEGPMLQPADAAAILTWIQAEAAERHTSGGDTIKTDAVEVTAGDNTVPLDNVGAKGATLTFTAQKLTQGLYLSRIAIHAGTGGVHVTHPLFVTWADDKTPTPDPVDSFDRVDLDVAQDQAGAVGGGLLMLPSVGTTAKLSVTFKKVGPAVGTGGPTQTLPGCKAVASFTQNAKPPLAQSCVGCHGGGNGGATSATDMTKVNDTSAAGQAAACGQILGRVDLANPAASGILVAADPNSGASHPFKFSANQFTTFKTSLTAWITAEKAAAP